AEALGTTDLNGGALFNAEFGIRHRGSTVPERSGVALSFCRRPLAQQCHYRFDDLGLHKNKENQYVNHPRRRLG
ncbi:hypothetical protein RZ767_014610, partial [Pseudomonas aeruginosa]|nr:hypothetical protein [Pseudomonas aeruginosa]